MAIPKPTLPKSSVGKAVLAGVLLFISCSLGLFGYNSIPTYHSTLKLVIGVFRHGHRAPIQPYTNDPYKDPNYWPDGWQQLTKLGRLQMYELGQTLRSRYDGFLSDLYIGEEVLVETTLMERTYMSAAALLAGLYPPVGHQIWHKEIKWQPIPIWPEPVKLLDILYEDETECPRYSKLKSKAFAAVVKRHKEEHKDFWQAILKHTGPRAEKQNNVYAVADTLLCEAKLGLELPQWSKEFYPEKVTLMQQEILQALSAASKDTVRLRAGNFIGRLMSDLEMKSNGSLVSDRRLLLHSGHDTTLLPLLFACGIEHQFIIQPSSTLILELHQSEDGNYFIELHYLNPSETKKFRHLTIPGCGQQCDLKHFLSHVKQYVPDNWEEECNQELLLPKIGLHKVALAGDVILLSCLLGLLGYLTNTMHRSTLKLAIVVFRHGHRAPLYSYPNDPYKDPKYWPEGWQQLTKMFELGRTLRSRYDGFLSDLYIFEEVLVETTLTERTYMSAAALLAGLYPPVGHQIWHKEIKWQPIPIWPEPINLLHVNVHFAPFDQIRSGSRVSQNAMHSYRKNTKILYENETVCPRYSEMKLKANADLWERYKREHKDLWQALSKHTGLQIESHNTIYAICDTLLCQAEFGLPLPDWTKEFYPEKLISLSSEIVSMYAATSKETIRLRAGNFIGRLMTELETKSNGSLVPNRKLFLHSGHDTTIVTLLHAFGFQPKSLVKPGAALILELHQSGNMDHYVELHYLDHSSANEFQHLVIPECGQQCDFKKFQSLVKPFIPDDWEKECHQAPE